MDYMATIRRGWEHTWNNKFLWALGFLAALGSGSTFTGSNSSFNNGGTGGSGMTMSPEGMAALTGGLILFGCLASIVGIILWLVSLSARGGLIGAVTQMETGSDKPDFRSAFRMGWSKVWRLVGMTIVLYILPTILFIVVLVGFFGAIGGMAYFASGAEDPSAMAAGIGGMALIFVCLICLLMPIMMALSLIYPFAYRGIILRDMGIRESLRHGWTVVKTNLGEIIILGLAFFLIGLVVGFIVLAVLAPIALVVGVPFVALMQSDATVLQGILVTLGLLVAMVVTALISAVFVAWQSSTFTVAYLQWTNKQVVIE